MGDEAQALPGEALPGATAAAGLYGKLESSVGTRLLSKPPLLLGRRGVVQLELHLRVDG